jgi:hypothetical protein
MVLIAPIFVAFAHRLSLTMFVLTLLLLVAGTNAGNSFPDSAAPVPGMPPGLQSRKSDTSFSTMDAVLPRSVLRTSLLPSPSPVLPSFTLQMEFVITFGTPGLRGNDTTAARLLLNTCLGGLLRRSVATATHSSLDAITFNGVETLLTTYYNASDSSASSKSLQNVWYVNSRSPVNVLVDTDVNNCSGRVLVHSCLEDACRGEPLRESRLLTSITAKLQSLSRELLLEDAVAKSFSVDWFTASENMTIKDLVIARMQQLFNTDTSYEAFMGKFELEWFSALVASPAFDTTQAVIGEARAVALTEISVVSPAPSKSSLVTTTAFLFVSILVGLLLFAFVVAAHRNGASCERRRVHPNEMLQMMAILRLATRQGARRGPESDEYTESGSQDSEPTGDMGDIAMQMEHPAGTVEERLNGTDPIDGSSPSVDSQASLSDPQSHTSSRSLETVGTGNAEVSPQPVL